MAAQKHFLLSEANLKEHNTASAAQETGEQHFENAIRAEAAQYFYQTPGVSDPGSECAPQCDLLYLVSQQKAARVSPCERFAAWSVCEDPMPLHCKLAMQREAVDYASFESIDHRQRLARLNMQSMPATEKETRVQSHQARSSQALSYSWNEQHAMIVQQAFSGLPEMLEMQQANVKDEAEVVEEEDEGYGGSDRASPHLSPAAT
ncbi:hypothetical protein B0A48_15797 [Cryoendolithus antarcticus]|uniref:Uncharacterized protein n=1 Tax=Cryoendolithus antarcticus TaxID=1507870 RepID=A0A1V8SHC0_9PEZI|nr:hypothetical protein B0A48_15797 [Cryoendolithus antarcticus]